MLPLMPVGLLVGFLTAFAMVAMQGGAWSIPDFLLTSILTGLVLGGILTGLTRAYVRLVPRSRVTVVGLAVAVAVVTSVGGIGLLAGAAALPHGKWTRLPDPPMPLSGFAGPTCYSLSSARHVVFATTFDGRYLSYGPTSEDGWVLRSSVPVNSREDIGPCSLDGSEKGPRVPGQIVALHSVREVGADCGGTTYYVLKYDGSVWESGRFACGIGTAVLFFLYVGLLAVTSVGAGLGCTSRALRWRRQATPSQGHGQGAS